ncbi:ABC transporter ATP-binding protein [Marinospirillum alkaliphilum]|uniref:Iron(III) transport system ATP-binding protein n=1 Tax=Marinospirillum alkaliphilum DSM 21637 TaxID=1122209 RepID=A0A1K1WYE4_9GAMM|nr:ABC transporter ATP-binding protein [Marinospirillum alkaliphilum]SFX42295.1 iron(III) transport system ATP-binding protein [Marinospirillum alkaliphilum DSM 21637]
MNSMPHLASASDLSHKSTSGINPLMRVEGLCKRYQQGEALAVNQVSFTLQPGEILALLGPSGCGKTTTLRMLAGFEHPESGRIFLHGQDVTELPPQKRHIGIVFQDYALFPHMSLLRNVTFAMRHVPTHQQEQKAMEWLELVGLAAYAKRHPHELSGGQQQRVALARTLAAEPELVLLDEPFSNLDAALRESTRKEMRALFKKAGTSVILVTHDQAEAMTFADKVGVMQQGKLIQLDTPQQVYQHPATAFVAKFLGHTNLLQGLAQGNQAQTPLGAINLSSSVEGEVHLSLRPEDLTLSASDDPAAARVVDREFRGHDYLYVLEQDGLQYCAITPSHNYFEIGSHVAIQSLRQASVLPSSNH